MQQDEHIFHREIVPKTSRLRCIVKSYDYRDFTIINLHPLIRTPHVIAICGMTALNTKLRCEVAKVPYTFQLQSCSNLGHVLCT